MTDALSLAVKSAFAGIKDSPRRVLSRVNLSLEEEGLDPVTTDDIVELITTAEHSDPARVEYFIRVVDWYKANSISTPAFAATSGPRTEERLTEIHRALGFDEAQKAALVEAMPFDSKPFTVIAPGNWEPWYPSEECSSFYWDRYVEVLERKGFGPEAISALDESTDQVIGRLTNPRQRNPHQSKGLVMGYVQSGKTANFAGTIAKAIDSGYKLIIVLTGTIELLRAQTQKRLDKELVGQENVIGAGPAATVREIEERIADMESRGIRSGLKYERARAELEDATKDIDYVLTDLDWKNGDFNSFGGDPRSSFGAPRIVRLTGVSKDYRSLAKMLLSIDFRKNLPDPNKALYEPENIDSADVWLAVVKKEKTALNNLQRDLNNLETKLGEIPALIIDDEADQASVNTKRPKTGRVSAADKDRTAINKAISAIIRTMPRAQYVAYTATPFANVFVDPDDSADIFPKDFIIALEPSPEYMGAKQYHDLQGAPEEPTVANSNELAYYRRTEVDVDGMASEDDLQRALDAYVLSGAIKLWRREQLERQGEKAGSLRHHTMMIHEGAKLDVHSGSKTRVERLWQTAGFESPAGIKRLRDLWVEDFAPVSAARAAGAPVPENFNVLKPYVAQAVAKIDAGQAKDGRPNPVILVNGSKEAEYRQAEIDFDARDVWKILVGGTKLSRGFTVEGLTITVYTRVSVSADTLMQMGRWYGYRKYYRDLVRLYMGAGIVKSKRVEVDIYDAFTEIARDEEEFREELKQYSVIEEGGMPALTPAQVAPMVTQRLPWLKPTNPAKMYNAEITEKGLGGRVKDMFLMKPREENANGANVELTAKTIFPKLTEHGKFLTDGNKEYDVLYGIIPADEVRDYLRAFTFLEEDSYTPEVAFLSSRVPNGKIKDFVVYLPLLNPAGAVSRQVPVIGDVPILKRKRRPGRSDFSGSSARQRVASEVIARAPMDPKAPGNGGLARDLSAKGRGALLLTIAADQLLSGTDTSDPSKLSTPPDLNDLVILPSITTPYSPEEKGVIRHQVKRPDQPNSPIVDVNS